MAMLVRGQGMGAVARSPLAPREPQTIFEKYLLNNRGPRALVYTHAALFATSLGTE